MSEENSSTTKKYDNAFLDKVESPEYIRHQKELAVREERLRVEENRIRKENQRKLEEHKQRIKAIEESEYNVYDEKRAKAADELMWMDFETRMRNLIK